MVVETLVIISHLWAVSQCRLHPRWKISSGNWYQRWRICNGEMGHMHTGGIKLLEHSRKAKQVRSIISKWEK